MSLWDVKAAGYESARRLFPFNLVLKQESDNVRELLQSTEPDGKAILDAGTGTGETLSLLPAQSRRYALDRSPGMLRRAARKKPNLLIAADGLAVPFKSSSVDIIAAIGLLEYCQDRLALLREFRRVLRPSGFLILTYSQPNALNLLRFVLGHRIHFMQSKEMAALVERLGFVCMAHLQSPIQEQLLLKKN